MKTPTKIETSSPAGCISTGDYWRFLCTCHARIQRGYGGSGHPSEKSQNIGFLSNAGPDPMKNHKATKPAFNVGPSSARHRNAIKWRIGGGPKMTPFSGVWIPSPLFKEKNVGPPDKTFWIRACMRYVHVHVTNCSVLDRSSCELSITFVQVLHFVKLRTVNFFCLINTLHI